MEDHSYGTTFDDDDSLKIIFIGKHKSTSEIHIDKLPTVNDVLYLTSNKRNQEQHLNHYKYLNLKKDKIVFFQYEDGIRKNSGRILLEKDNLQIIFNEPLKVICNYFLFQRGDSISFFMCPPLININLEYKDSSMICAEGINIPGNKL